MKSIVIGCDSNAVNLKDIVIKLLEEKNISYEDMGVIDNDDKTYYPLIAKRVCEKIIESNYEKDGILICGTGLGMAMTANKFKGIRAGVCHDNYSAERLRLSNDGNVLCMGALVIGTALAKKIVSEWLSLKFGDSPSTVKVNAIKEIEKETMK